MPSEAEHEDQYVSNLKTIDLLSTSENPPYDWIVTIYFYAAVHLIEKKYAQYGKHNGNHLERNDCVKTFFKKIQVYYESLYIDSQSARYDCVEMTPGKVALAKNHLEQINRLIARACLKTTSMKLFQQNHSRS